MNMKRARTNVFLFSVSALSCVCLISGCEDQQAKQAHDDAEQIVNTRAEYLTAVTSENKVSDLQALARGLPSAASTPASGLMSANANLDIAEVKLLEANRLERENQTLRSVVDGVAGEAMKLAALADAHEGFDDRSVRAAISKSTRDADSGLDAIKGTIAELEEPIGHIETLNSGDREEVAHLRAQSRQLREQAYDAGDFKGHAMVQQAVTFDKQADAIEGEIAQREIELIGLKSELRIAHLRHELFGKQKTASSETSSETTQTIDQFNAIARDIRGTLGEYERKVDQAMQAITSNMDALDGLYADAAEASDTAARAASTAGGRDRQAANAVKARAQQTLGRSHTEKAAGLGSHASLLSRMVKSGVGGTQHVSNAKTTATAAQDAQTAAAAAFQEAINTLESAGNNPDVAMLRQLLNKAATGEPVDFSAFEVEQPSGGGGGRPAGFATADELFDYVKSMAGRADAVDRMLDVVYAATPQESHAVQVFRNLSRSGQLFGRAVQQRFPQVAGQMGISNLMNMAVPELSNATVAERTDDKVVYAYTVLGIEDTLVLERIDGTWWIDASDLLVGEVALDSLEEAARFYEKLAGQLERGEISTQVDLMRAMQEAAGTFGGG